MKFKLDDNCSDILKLIAKLRAAEEANRAAKGDKESRDLLNVAAHTLNECQSLMVSVVNDLEVAIAKRAGLMDSVTRHEEIADAKNKAMETAVRFLRSYLTQCTAPPATPKREQFEVI